MLSKKEPPHYLGHRRRLKDRLLDDPRALAEYEVHVARYYYSRGAYVAAINRAQLALSEYRNVPAAEDALGVLLNSYNALGMDQLRDDARRVPDRTLPDWLVKLAALADPAVKQILPELGRRKNATSDKARRLLGWSPRSREDALVATAASLRAATVPSWRRKRSSTSSLASASAAGLTSR